MLVDIILRLICTLIFFIFTMKKSVNLFRGLQEGVGRWFYNVQFLSTFIPYKM